MNRETGLPIGATGVYAYRKGVKYPIDDSHIHTREGELGTHPVLVLFERETFEGEILPGGWIKGWDSGISVFTASIQSGDLALSGVAAVAGTGGEGWLNQVSPIILIDTTEITVSMEVPVDDTGAVASRDISEYFYLRQDKNEDNPTTDNNYLRIYYSVDEDGIRLVVNKEINGANTNLAFGKDYNMASDRGVGDLEATVWRLVPHGKPGTSGAHIHIYLKQSDTITNAKAADEHEITGSPFDTDDWAFHVAYIGFQTWTQNTTYFGSLIGAAEAALVGEVSVTYPDFEVKYAGGDDRASAAGPAQIYDGDPDNGGVLVESLDHSFSSDPYLQNGLVRAPIWKESTNGFHAYVYAGGAWRQTVDAFFHYLDGSAINIQYTKFLSIVSLSPEKIVLKMRWLDSSVDNEDYYLDSYVTLKRGSLSLSFDFIGSFPTQSFKSEISNSARERFVYIGDGNLADTDLDNVALNSVISDNYFIAFDEDREGYLIGFGLTQLPGGISRMFGRAGRWIDELITIEDTEASVINISMTAFPLVGNLFREAEAFSVGLSTRSFMDGEGDAVDSLCEAQGDRVGGFTINEDAWANWQFNDIVTSQSTTYGLKMEGSESVKIVVATIPSGNWYLYETAIAPNDWSGEDFVGFWWYGNGTNDSMQLRLTDGAAANRDAGWLDDTVGWKYVAFPLSFFDVNIDLTDVVRVGIRCATPISSPGKTYYLDYFNVYTVNTDTLWTETANCTIDVFDEVEEEVGNYCTKITADAGAVTVNADVTPVAPLGDIRKFDFLKFWLKENGASVISIALYDADGDYVAKSSHFTDTMTEYSWALPHSSTDLEGWAEVGSFDFSTFSYIRIAFYSTLETVVYLDGVQFYIGTTTTRGRGEILSGGEAMVFDTRNEFIYMTFNPLEDYLPIGRYIFVASAKDTDQVAGDFRMFSHKQPGPSYTTNENQGQAPYHDLTGLFSYPQNVLDVREADGGFEFRFYVWKQLITENTVFVDYVLFIPLSNGLDFPLDIAHAALQTMSLERTPDYRAS